MVFSVPRGVPPTGTVVAGEYSDTQVKIRIERFSAVDSGELSGELVIAGKHTGVQSCTDELGNSGRRCWKADPA